MIHSSKKSLMDEIAAKAKRKEDLRQEIASRSENIEAFAVKMIGDIEEMIATTSNPDVLYTLIPLYARSFEGQVRVMDPGATVNVDWFETEGHPRINGITIRWSKEYQVRNKCEEQLFVDVSSLLLK